MAVDEGAGFREKYGPWALVAGGSDGIGEHFARGIAARGVSVILVARREEVLAALAADLRAEHGVEVRTVAADLTRADLLDRLEPALRGAEVGLLVYNAGAVHGATRFLEAPVERALHMVRLNCEAPLRLAHRLGVPMRARGRGGIVIVSSMAGLAGSAYNSTYNAAKSFEIILAEGLWQELAPEGIDVMSVVAGATRTPSIQSSVRGVDSYPNLMEPADVARGALEHLGRGPCWIPGEANRAIARMTWPVAREKLVNRMSEATAKMHGLPFVAVEGTDQFGE